MRQRKTRPEVATKTPGEAGGESQKLRAGGTSTMKFESLKNKLQVKLNSSRKGKKRNPEEQAVKVVT